MEYYVLLLEEADSSKAIGAFSNKERLDTYLASHPPIPSARFERVELPDKQASENVLYAAFESHDSTHYQLVGCYSNRYESILAAGQCGFVDKLSVDRDELNTHSNLVAKKSNAKKRKVDVNRLNGIKHLALEDEPLALPEEKRVQKVKRAESFDWQKYNTRSNQVLAGLCFALTIVLGAVFSANSSVEFAEKQHSVEWLPAKCTQVSYFISEDLKVYEFKAPYDVFTKWARTEGLQLEQIQYEEPVEVMTYRKYAPVSVPQSSGISEDAGGSISEEAVSPEIEVGFKIVDVNNRDGVECSGAYDLEKGVVYYWSKQI